MLSTVKNSKTRGAWQSQTWGRPTPQVRVPNQFQEDEIPLAVMAGRMKKFSENTSTIPEVMDSTMLNFKANFKFSRFLFGGPLSPPLRVCASKPWSISSVYFWYVDPEIYAIKVESCKKSRQILDDFFAVKNFWGGHCKNCTHFIIPASRGVEWKSPVRILPLAQKLLSLKRWILRQIFNFHD